MSKGIIRCSLLVIHLAHSNIPKSTGWETILFVYTTKNALKKSISPRIDIIASLRKMEQMQNITINIPHFYLFVIVHLVSIIADEID